MTDHELEEFERQLRQTKPARLPETFTARLLAAEPEPSAQVVSEPVAPAFPDYLRTLRLSLRWLIPATAMAVAVMMAWHGSLPSARRLPGAGATPATMKADDVKIDQRMVSSFDAVARLPGGEPVRFRCESWVDQITLSDKSRGLVVENSRPRLEVVPVGFETY
ncbi:MAG: hypothetical protein WDN00_04445 [Limisphaerales bacterium]